MFKRGDVVFYPEMSKEEIAIYNAKAYDSIGTGMVILRDADKWIPPKVEGYTCHEKATRIIIRGHK